MEKDRFSQDFNILINYWELKPSQYEAKLHELALKDIRTVSAFVPWAHLETDIYHSLKKFVRAAWVAKINIRLFVMPELGVNYPNAGFPKDLLVNTANLAVDRVGRVIYNHAAPNIFPLPSFSSPEVLKRFGNYLIKIGSVLAEVFNEVGRSDFCEIVVTNTLFNYYRSHGLSLSEHGDYSAAHVMAFRDFVDREYRGSESAANAGSNSTESYHIDNEQFKMQVYEGYNRHRFFTHVEKLLREKTEMVFARKNSSCSLRHVDLSNPECDPDAAYQGILLELFNFHPSVQRYYQSIIAGGYRNEAICLSNSGIFRRFSDQEKSFLILAALIHSGEVAVMADELFKLSPNFQRKLRTLIDFLAERKYVRQNRATYISASKFSMESLSFKVFAELAPGVITVVGGLDSHRRKLSERLVFMDPRSVIRLVELVQLLSLAQTGKVVAIPMPMKKVLNYTGDAIDQFEKFKKGRDPLRINMGIPYEVYEYQLGQVIFYDPTVFWAEQSPRVTPDAEPSSLRPSTVLFFQALLGLADIRSLCHVSDSRLHLATYVSEEDQNQRLVFLINPTQEKLDAKLSFSDEVLLASLPQSGGSSSELVNPILGKSFEVSVPPLGVLSMVLTEPSQSEIQEAREKSSGSDFDRQLVVDRSINFDQQVVGDRSSTNEVVQWT